MRKEAIDDHVLDKYKTIKFLDLFFKRNLVGKVGLKLNEVEFIQDTMF